MGRTMRFLPHLLILLFLLFQLIPPSLTSPTRNKRTSTPTPKLSFPKPSKKQTTKTKPSSNSSIDILILTYNLATSTTTIPMDKILPPTPPSMIFVTTQETETLKPRRTEGRSSLSLRRSVITSLPNYTPCAIHSIGGVQGILMVSTPYLKNLKSVSVEDVACGLGNVVHNKGAVIVEVEIKGGGRVVFVGGHLAAHEGKVKERNEDYKRIHAGGISRWGSDFWSSSAGCFWAGDLNYRLEVGRRWVDWKVKMNASKGKVYKEFNHEYGEGDSGEGVESGVEGFMKFDQLRDVMSMGLAFEGLVEGRVGFPMTYKFDKNKMKYDVEAGGRVKRGERSKGAKRKKGGKRGRWEGLKYDSSAKMRVPSYTDRVLYKPYHVDGGGGWVTRCVWYDSVGVDDGSDHKPVAGLYVMERVEGEEEEKEKEKEEEKEEEEKEEEEKEKEEEKEEEEKEKEEEKEEEKKEEEKKEEEEKEKRKE